MTERGRRQSRTLSSRESPSRESEPLPESTDETESEPARDSTDAERALGRAVAVGLPIVAVVSAIVVGSLASIGSGLLVLASGALLGAIALLWASVRTLSGDAPLPADLEALAARTHDVDALDEDKRRVLRALKDLEGEHAIGKIDDADYELIAAQYRDRAKVLMREMDLNAAPGLAEAERVANEYLAKQGLGAPPPSKSSGNGGKGDTRRSRTSIEVGAPPASESRETIARLRLACPDCATSNEPDAAFCKKCGAAMKTAGAPASKEGDATS
jgi:hypothetical protein